MAANGCVDVEAADFEMDDDDLMDEEIGAVVSGVQAPKLRSAITGASSAFAAGGGEGGEAPKKTKGRGPPAASPRRTSDSLGSDGGPGPQRYRHVLAVQEVPKEEIVMGFTTPGPIRSGIQCVFQI